MLFFLPLLFTSPDLSRTSAIFGWGFPKIWLPQKLEGCYWQMDDDVWGSPMTQETSTFHPSHAAFVLADVLCLGPASPTPGWVFNETWRIAEPNPCCTSRSWCPSCSNHHRCDLGDVMDVMWVDVAAEKHRKTRRLGLWSNQNSMKIPVGQQEM